MSNLDPFIYSQIQAAGNTADEGIQDQCLYWIARRSGCLPVGELPPDGRLSQGQKLAVMSYVMQNLADLAMGIKRAEDRRGGVQP